MTVIENLLTAGTPGTNVTQASTTASGDTVTYLTINGSVAQSGSSAIMYSDALSGLGVPVCVNFPPQAGDTCFRYDIASSETRRYVTRRAFYTPAFPSLSSYSSHMTQRLSAAFSSGISLATNRDKMLLITGAGSAFPGSTSTISLSPNTIYYFELAVTPATTESSSDGILEYKVTTANDEEVVSLVLPGYQTPVTTTTVSLRFGGTKESTYNTYIWDIQGMPLASGWIGPRVVEVPLDTPVLTLVSDEKASSPSANDREITVSWSAVNGADSYTAYVASYESDDWIAVENEVTSPYTFLNRPGAAQRVGIQAIP